MNDRPTQPQRYIKITWRQRGHSTKDPCGHEEHFLNCVWESPPEWADMGTVMHELRKADRYCSQQDGWVWWEVTAHDGEQSVIARTGGQCPAC